PRSVRHRGSPTGAPGDRRSRRSDRSRPRKARWRACRKSCPGRSSRGGGGAAGQAWDPPETKQCNRGEQATKALQYTKDRVLHWEIMGLRTAIALLMLIGAGVAVFLGHEVLTPTEALQSGTVSVDIPAHDGILGIAGRLYQAKAI